jgi:hypothetical protein
MNARGFLDDYPWAGLLLVPISVGAAVWIVLSIIWPSPRTIGQPTSDPEVRLCDAMVEALLHSKDLTEVTRAGIIVREIPCGIGRRLP